MPQQRPPINKDVLAWALNESGMATVDLASRIKVEPEELTRWIEGAARPTRAELGRLAAQLKRPTTVFFLTSAPPPSVPPTLRRAVGRVERSLTPDEIKEVRRARRTQRLVSLLVRESAVPRIELPLLAVHSGVQHAGSLIRTWLDVSLDDQRAWATPREAFSAWRDRTEERGVLVMQLRLGTKGLRGFSLDDDYAPLVAVNTAENVQARIFTLMHELAHLVSRTVSSCLEDTGSTSTDGSIEKWCDRVASAVVIPRTALVSEFESRAQQGEATVEVVQQIADLFSTSLRATAVALIDAGLASFNLYSDIEERYPASDYTKGFGRGAPQRAPQRRLGELGPRAASLVLGAVATRRLTERDARQYLRLDGAELSELAAALEASA